MTHFDPNDPRLTAFSLGELTGDEQAEFAAHVETCPNCARMVDEIKHVGELIAAGLSHEEPQRVLTLPDRTPPRRRRKWGYVLATAASICGIGITATMLMDVRHPNNGPIVAESNGSTSGVVNQSIEEEIKPSKDVALVSTTVSQAIGVHGAVSSGEKSASIDYAPPSTQYEVRTKDAAPTVNKPMPAPTPAAAPRPTLAPHVAYAHDPQSTATHDFFKRIERSGLPFDDRKPIDALDSDMPIRQGSSNQHNTEAYARIHDNPFLEAKANPLSTFSIDVDTASYSNVRRFLTGGQLPPPDAVRIEELLNYFSYDYWPPTDDRPFSTHVEVASCPWMPAHRLVRVGLKGKVVTRDERPAANLVFLIDVSGSMSDANKLPLVQKAMRLLVDQLDEKDRVTIVVYAGASGLVLDTTPAYQKEKILDAIDRLQAGGSTNGGAGIQLAYDKAAKNFIKSGVNRVILATDGDFNVGVTNQGDLTRLIEEKAKSGVFLSVLGFGMGNYKDSTLEQLADKGNGNYGYIDTLNEARKLFVEQVNGTLVTIAKDVKIQIEFNPAQVAAYRLIGYENRMLRKEDFNDDTKDAGEIGAGHTVTALYEIVPVGVNTPAATQRPAVDPLKYQNVLQPAANPVAADASDELLTLKLRYKQPDGETSKLIESPVKDNRQAFDGASADFRFAASVAAFGMRLRRSEHAGDISWPQIVELARKSTGEDASGYRHEFVSLVEQAARLQSGP